ncbi:MAG: hypothetical protein LBS23_03325 [Holosporaceae bacterium]|jgi:cell division transport system permease protein|nr:hypothetical protein [Holosporaceae bacterium]
MAFSLKYNYDFDFNSDKSNRFIPFIIGFLMYCISLAVMSCVFTCNLTADWRNALNGRITVEIQPTDGTESHITEKQKNGIVEVINSTKGVKSVKKLKETDILKILEPWLSSTAIPDDFPFPIIFDVETEKDAAIDLLDLSNKLSKICQGIRIHDHANWYAPILNISNGLFSFSLLLSILIFVTVCSTIIFITKKTLSVHKSIVKILQLIGASNLYIASQFKRYYFVVGCRSSWISVFLGIVTILGVNFVSATDFLNINTFKYIMSVIAIPIITTMLIMIASKNTVLFFLNSDEWIN